MSPRPVPLAPLLQLLLLAGCTVGPDYRPPEPKVPADWSEPGSVGVTTTVEPVADWWRMFGDPELDSLVERAVGANHDLRIAEARVLEARALRGGAVADFGPTVDVGATYDRVHSSRNLPAAPGAQLDTNVYEAGFDASWEIDVFGGKKRALESASAEVAASVEGRRDVLVSLLAEVARNYVELRSLQRRMAITRDHIAAQRAALELTRARFRAGMTGELDVTQAGALLARTQADLPTLGSAAKQTVHRLGVLLGLAPGALLEELAPEAPLPNGPAEVPIGLPSELLTRRPDVRRAERELAAATAQIGVETAELFPKFALVGAAGLRSAAASNWLAGDSQFWFAGPVVSWRLFDMGRIKSQVAAAGARAEQALSAYEKAVLVALEDVENALAAHTGERARHDALAESVAANRRALELANERYSKGLGDYLSVLDAQRSLYRADDELVQSQRTVTQDLIALYKALGGGWRELDGRAPANGADGEMP